MTPAHRRTAAMVLQIMDDASKARRFYWTGVVLSLLGVFWFASYPWLTWLSVLLGILFLFPGIGLIFKWGRVVKRYNRMMDSWGEYFEEGVDEPPGVGPT